MRIALASLILVLAVGTAAAQGTRSYEIQQPKGPWRVPGEIQQPKGPWRVPGEVQEPRGPWREPGEIQVPRGIEAVRTVPTTTCERRLSVVGDALFDFDKANLRRDAEETLSAAAPEIAKLGGKPARVEGHTDAIGSDAYNQRLSEARAATVRNWLAAHGMIPAETPIRGFGKTNPVAPNATPDGQDDPEGRQKNRRVDVVFDVCT